MSGTHSQFSPSGTHTWMLCPASLRAQEGQPNVSSSYATDGTASHTLAAWCLEEGFDAAYYVGETIEADGDKYVVDPERAEYVQMYVDYVRNRVKYYEAEGYDVELHIEKRVYIGHITEEQDGGGTADCTIIASVAEPYYVIQEEVDLKYGAGVAVSAERNSQLLMYAAGGVRTFLRDRFPDEVVLTIHQPRITGAEPSSWSCTGHDLKAWIELFAVPAVKRARVLLDAPGMPDISDYRPGEKQCKFCTAAALCPARQSQVQEMMGEDFAVIEASPTAVGEETYSPKESVALLSLERLAELFPLLPMLETWMTAIRARIDYEMLQGAALPGLKLVEGRKGRRSWFDVAEAENALKRMRLKQEDMYDFSLKSPTQIQKVIGKAPRKWKKIEGMIGQSSGKPSVVLDEDPRPALERAPADEGFDIATEPSDIDPDFADFM